MTLAKSTLMRFRLFSILSKIHTFENAVQSADVSKKLKKEPYCITMDGESALTKMH